MSGRVWLCSVLIALGLSLPGCGEPMAQKKERGHPQRGHVYVQMGRYRDAIDSFQKAVELDPDAVEARVALGNFYRLVDRWEEAERAYLEVRRLRPSRVDLHILLGDLHTLSGRRAEGVRDYLEAWRLKPQNGLLKRKLSEAYLSLSNQLSAISSLADG